MKYFHRFKGLIFIALACLFTAQGSTVNSAVTTNNPSNNKNTSVGNVIITAGQTQNYEAAANLTVSGENNPTTVENKGIITLSAGKSILLLPGTRISSGGFLYAAIEPISKNGKHQKKQIKLVTVEENQKIEEQASLSVAFALFSPFPACNRGHLHAGDAEHGSFSASNNDLSGVAPEQQRKVAVDSRLLREVTRKQMLINFTPIPVAYAFRFEAMRVLRL